MVGQSKTPRRKKPAPVSDRERITQVLRVIQEVYEFYGFQSEGYSLSSTTKYWLAGAESVGWIAWTKFKLAAFFAVQIDQTELPVCPVPGSTQHPGVLLGGLAYKWVRKFLREADQSTKTSFLASILYAKYGMPLPSEKDCLEEARATASFLTKQHPELKSLSFLPEEDFSVQAPLVFPPYNGKPFLDPGFTGVEEAQCVKENPNAWASDYFDNAHHNLPNRISAKALRSQLERTVDELFPPVDDALKARQLWENEVRPYHPRFPSTNGNYNRGRAKGGAVGDVHAVAKWAGLTDRHDNLVVGKWVAASSAVAQVKERAAHRRGQEHKIAPVDQSQDETHAAADEHRVGRVYSQAERAAALASLEDEEDFRPVGAPVEHTPPSTEGLVFLADDSTLVEKSTKLWTAVQQLSLVEEPLVEPVGLAEALKVRVITKGPPLTYAALKPIQEYLHSNLRKHPCFALIGEEIHAGHVTNRMGLKLGADEFFGSGDYKASTNLLDPEVSNCIVKRICSNLQFPLQYRELFLRALTGHVFVEEDGSEAPQQWGQLMGSIVSFPILCIANAALSRWALEYGRRMPILLRDAPLMINGDDVLFKTNVYGWWAWKAITAAGGLQPSVGKVYTSRWYLNMNSTSFRRVSDESLYEPCDCPDRQDPRKTFRRPSPFIRIPFVNLRLLTANKRSMAVGDLGTKEMPLGARARELMRTCPFGIRIPVWKKFLNKNWKKLSAVRVPWYMPEWLGGLGLPWALNVSVDDVDDVHIIDDFGPTDVDLRKAHGIRLGWSRKRPLQTMPAASWAIHELVGQLLPVQPWETTTPVDTAGFDRLYGRLASETLLRADELSELQLDRKAMGQRVLRHNERLWAKAPYCAPLSLKEVLPRRTFTYLPVTFLT